MDPKPRYKKDQTIGEEDMICEDMICQAVSPFPRRKGRGWGWATLYKKAFTGTTWRAQNIPGMRDERTDRFRAKECQAVG